MAVVWNYGPKAGTVEHEGRVLSVGTRTVRVMSDVWDDERYYSAWDGEEVRDFKESHYSHVRPDGSFADDGYEEGVKGTYFWPTVTVDATEEVLEEVREWRRLNALAQRTQYTLRDACGFRPGREVVVTKGRKVPVGGGYEITAILRGYGDERVANLRHTSGKHYTYVSTGNLEVVDPVRYVEGAVACSLCRREFAEAWGAGMVSEEWAQAWCKGCRLGKVLAGKADTRLPRAAKNPHHRAFQGLRPITGVGEEMVRAIFEEPEEMFHWLALSDWLMDDDQGERGEALKVALVGKVKVKARPIRMKDLVFTPWEEHEEFGPIFHYSSVVTGFPKQDGFAAVKVHRHLLAAYSTLSTFEPLDSAGKSLGKPGYALTRDGILRRQILAALPPLPPRTPQGELV